MKLPKATDGGGGQCQPSPDGQLLYFIREGGLWRQPLSGDAATRPLPAVLSLASYDVTAKGIYFGSGEPGPSIQFLDFASGSTKAVMEIPARLIGGLSSSPDGKSLIWAQWDIEGADLMLVENFR